MIMKSESDATRRRTLFTAPRSSSPQSRHSRDSGTQRRTRETATPGSLWLVSGGSSSTSPRKGPETPPPLLPGAPRLRGRRQLPTGSPYRPSDICQYGAEASEVPHSGRLRASRCLAPGPRRCCQRVPAPRPEEADPEPSHPRQRWHRGKKTGPGRHQLAHDGRLGPAERYSRYGAEARDSLWTTDQAGLRRCCSIASAASSPRPPACAKSTYVWTAFVQAKRLLACSVR